MLKKFFKRNKKSLKWFIEDVKEYLISLMFWNTEANNKVSTKELVQAILNFCEVYSEKKMLPYQEQFGKRIIRSVLENDGEEITALFSRQSGKCFAKDTLILMSNGKTKKVQDVKVGDYVMSPKSTPVRVTNISRGREEMFEVKSREKWHESFTVNKSHILSVVDRKGKILNIDVENYLKLSNWKKQDEYRGYRVAVDFEEKPVEIDPYFYGLWLGDGSSTDVKITNTDVEVLEYLEEYAIKLGMTLKTYYNKSCNDYAITRGTNYGGKIKNPIRTFLKDNNLWGNKHIIDDYMFNSRAIRLKLLAGIIDSDGYINLKKPNTVEIGMSNEKLIYDVLKLIRSLGFRASIKEKTTNFNTKCWVILAYGDLSVIPTLIKRKQVKNSILRENPLTFGFDLIPKGVDDYFGFTLDSEDKLFLLGDYTVTHNTESVSIVSGGLMIILPQLANMPMFADDKRLEMFKDGLWIGIFAPSQRQAQITYSRVKTRIQCKSARAILEDPEFRLNYTTSNGQTVALSNGSFVTSISASDSASIEGESFKLLICDEAQDISNFKVQKSIHPMGAAYNSTIVKIGTATTHKGDFYEAIQRNKLNYELKKILIKNHFEYDYKVVSKYNPKYAKYVEKEKARLGENSDAFRMSYKLEWIIERGMFIDINLFEANNLENINSVEYDKTSNHVAGIDIGGTNDDTVITIVEVDWDMPVIMESKTNEDTGEEETYIAYNTYLVAWCRITGVPDYEEQYPMINAFLDKYKLSRIVCDATREASISHRLRANRREEVIPYIFNRPSKSVLYKNLDKEITTGRARVFASNEVKETIEYKEFLSQLADLEKGYSGTYMTVSHPDVKGAHDDFPDSWALAVYGASFKSEVDNTETRDGNNFRGTRKNNVMKNRNKHTARRR